MPSIFHVLHRIGIRSIVTRFFLISIQKPRIYIYKWLLSSNTPHLKGTRILQATQFVGRGKIALGKTTLGIWPSPSFNSQTYIEARQSSSSVTIGDNVYINNGAIIIADKTQIYISDNCLIGPFLTVFDSDFHGLETEDRWTNKYTCKPVHIGKNVFIGSHVTILRGVTIGENSVIGSGSVVTNSVPQNSIFAGNPAKLIRELKS